MPGRRAACIDIGSNTTRLLVAEPSPGGLREIASKRAYTTLGRIRAREPIPRALIEELAEAVATQVQIARAADAETIRLVATAAVRRAPNVDEIHTAIRERCGLGMQVLTGEDEARLSFAGATSSLRHPPIGEVGVVDVGGGSTELVVGTLAEGVTWSVSLDVGSGSLSAEHVRSDPPAASELADVRGAVQRAFADVRGPTPVAAYAVGGSANSLRRLVGAVLDHETLVRGLRVLTALSAAEVAQQYEMALERARLLPAGMLILDAAGEALSAPLRVARGGLREGVLLEELAAELSPG